MHANDTIGFADNRSSFSLRYIPSLDGLRAIAVALVLAFHAGVPLFAGAFIGVDVFFVLSGFLITVLLLDEIQKTGRIHLRNFYIRRALRLIPALLLVIVALNVLSLLFLPNSGRLLVLRESVIALFYVSNWARAFDVVPMGFLNHTWSLASEEQFYILWPLMLLLLVRLRLSGRALFSVVMGVAILSWLWRCIIIASGADVGRVYHALDTRLDPMMVGCAFAITLKYGLVKLYSVSSAMRSWIPALALGVIVLMGMLLRYQLSASYFIGITITIICTITILYFILTPFANPGGWFKQLLENKVLVYIGRISYGIYLWHLLIFRVFWQMFNVESWVVVFFVGSALTLIVASLSYFLIEKRALKLKTRFTANMPPLTVIENTSPTSLTHKVS